MIRIDQLAERLSSARIAAFGAVGAGAPLVATLWATGIGDFLLVAASLSSGVTAGWVWRRRRLLLSLPLEIGAHAVRAEVDGSPLVRFRVRLGHGRRVSRPEVHATLRAPGAPPRALVAELPAERMFGPWTVTLRDPHATEWPEGEIAVRVEVEEGGRRWTAERVFTAVREDRFVPPVLRSRGRVELERERWDTLEPRALPEPDTPA